MKFEERIERVLFEVGDRHWDLLVFTETWRKSREEVLETDHGHMWLGSGGTEHQNGVGFLLHKRQKYSNFKALTERVASINIRLHSMTLKVIAV